MLAQDDSRSARSAASSASCARIAARSESVKEKRTAERIAERVFGVVAVEDQLEVRHLDSQKPKDAELRADILQALMLDNLVPASIDTEVEDGVVASTGSADWHYQRDAAKLTAARSTGRLDVVDEIGREAPIVISPGRIVQLVRLARKRREI